MPESHSLNMIEIAIVAVWVFCGGILGYVAGRIHADWQSLSNRGSNTMTLIKRLAAILLILSFTGVADARSMSDPDVVYSDYGYADGYYDCTGEVNQDWNSYFFYLMALWAGHTPHWLCMAG